MTADIKLLPLPEHIEAGEFTFDAHVFEHVDMVSYARANVAHATEPLKAEIEALLVRADAMAGEAIKHEARAERLAEALRELVEVFSASGMYDAEVFDNARTALRYHDQEGGNP